MPAQSSKPDLLQHSLLQNEPDDVVVSIRQLHVSYRQRQVLQDINLSLRSQHVTALIGPSGCGKSTLLRCLNRLNDLDERCTVTGQVLVNGRDIYAVEEDVVSLRREVGMVFQRPNPFPKSIFDNVAYGLRLLGVSNRSDLQQQVRKSLQDAALWDEVHDRLHSSALELSNGQQQRLVIARALAVQPKILLLDEPASNLDPISMLKLEELIASLKINYTILIVTHNMQQAARVSDFTAFMDAGELVEFSATSDLFTTPKQSRTEDYITGRYG